MPRFTGSHAMPRKQVRIHQHVRDDQCRFARLRSGGRSRPRALTCQDEFCRASKFWKLVSLPTARGDGPQLRHVPRCGNDRLSRLRLHHGSCRPGASTLFFGQKAFPAVERRQCCGDAVHGVQRVGHHNLLLSGNALTFVHRARYLHRIERVERRSIAGTRSAWRTSP